VATKKVRKKQIADFKHDIRHEHLAAEGDDKGKYVKTNSTTGEIEYGVIIKYAATPPQPTAAGELMELVICDDFLYICVVAGAEGVAKWKRAPLRNYNT
jgi:hypothetical protein